MNARAEVLESGWGVTIQDRGRRGYRHLGVPISGALDPVLMAAANALLRNPPDAAVLEVLGRGPTLRVISGPVRLVIAGEAVARVVAISGHDLSLPAWQTATLSAGEVVRLEGSWLGVGYVGVSGGFTVDGQLGSRSTHVPSAIGGVEGRAVIAGDVLPCRRCTDDLGVERRATLGWRHSAGPIRVILGPQSDHFTSVALARFLQQPYRVTRDMDRMGLRLEGEALAHNERGAEIVSDGVAPGSIQVPPIGQPIVLLADCQTTGGYAKIATVIRADLPRLAHLRPGDEIRFCAVDHAAASAARREQQQRFARWAASIESFRSAGRIDHAALYGGNLISGALRGDEALPDAEEELDGHFPGERRVG